MDGYLTKPLRLPALREALEKWLPQAPAGETAQSTNEEQIQPPPGRGVLDINVLKDLVGDEPGSLYELLKDFLGALSAGMAGIRSAAGAEGFDEVGSLAHRLKSSSRSVGALPLGDACAELENSSRLGNKAIAAAAVAAFETAAEELLPKLREQLQQLEVRLRLEANPHVSGWEDDEDPAGRR